MWEGKNIWEGKIIRRLFKGEGEGLDMWEGKNIYFYITSYVPVYN